MSSVHAPLDITQLRTHFPSLGRTILDTPITYLDGPAGTQVPHEVIEAISHYYKTSNSNSHGYFTTAKETDQLLDTTRNAVADFLNAPSGACISFGQNMTTLNFSLSNALVKKWKPGDEVLITQMDHEANRQPWIKLKEQGIIVKEINMLPAGVLDYEDARNKISDRTKLVALGWASNITGTVNDVNLIRDLTKKVGAFLLLDAVHYAAHFSMDVQAVDCDFLLCSAYKFYGPHVGLLYCRPGLLDTLDTDRLRTQPQKAPQRIETGTLNHAAIAGVQAAVNFIAGLGTGDSLKNKIKSGFEFIAMHERAMASMLFDGLQKISGIQMFGPDFSMEERAPTISFYHDTVSAQDICKQLAERQVQAWSGHFYAIRSTEVTGLIDKGGVTRMGISAYTHEADINRTLQVMHEIVS